jgi:UDP-N-acetylglucosamine--N-acetylmuramyl-(pentapeptide) pyrophosphoryl-undecaprenol N-acetylglucosamine transferase
MGFVGLTRARTAILEQNSVPGFTNRILGRVVHRVFCAFPGTESRFPTGHASITGNPIRSSMKRLPAASRDPFVIFIFGGSQGALGINTLVLDSLPHLADALPRLRFIHQTGEADHARVLAGHQKAGSQARVEKFIHDMKTAYSEASLLVCRAGSSTLSEIAAVGRAAVLVPLPTAADNHQEKNARVFTDTGAAFLLPQRVSRGEDLARLIRQALADTKAIARMEESVTRFDRPNAARDIVQTLSDSC